MGFQPCNLPAHLSANDCDPAFWVYPLFCPLWCLIQIIQAVYRPQLRLDQVMCPCPWFSEVLQESEKAFAEEEHKQRLQDWNLTTAFYHSSSSIYLLSWQQGYLFYHCCFICPIKSRLSIFKSVAWLYLRQSVPSDRLIRSHFLPKFCSLMFLYTFTIRVVTFSLHSA